MKNNPFLEVSSTCREMHSAGDYDHNGLSKRGLASLAGWADKLYSQTVISLIRNGWTLTWVMYQWLCLVFIAHFCLLTCWPQKLRYAFYASRRELCILALLMLIDMAYVDFETLVSRTLFLVGLYIAGLSDDGQSGEPVRWSRIMGFAFVTCTVMR